MAFLGFIIVLGTPYISLYQQSFFLKWKQTYVNVKQQLKYNFIILD